MFSTLIYQTGKGNDHLVPVLVPMDVAAALCLCNYISQIVEMTDCQSEHKK